MTSLIGQQLGRYIIQEEIGRGGMARVYRALDTSLLQRTVALKVLAPALAYDVEFIRRFEREARIAANFSHPNIVTVFDVGEHNGLHYIAMEYIRGRTLHAILNERGALGLGFAIAIIGPVALALDYAHGRDAVHRDVKPHNVMIDADGRVLLTDFGIAQAPEPRGAERLTRTGIFMGTPEYISPEQASAQRVDGRSDLYSLGITAYEVITGEVPFSGATPQLMIAHLQTPPPPISMVDPDQPPELDLVLARALAKNPDKRFDSGASLTEALRNVARKHNIRVATPAQLAELAFPREDVDVTPASARPPRLTPLPAPEPPVRPPRRDAETQRAGQRDGSAQNLRADPPVIQPRPRAPVPAARRPWLRFQVALPVAILVVALLGLLLARGIGAPAPPDPNRSITPVIPSPTAEPPTATIAPSDTPAIPTATLEPTVVIPTPAPLDPTATNTPEPVPPTRRPPTPEPPTPEPPTPEPPTLEPPTLEPPTLEPPTPEPPTPEPPTPEPPTLTPEPPTETPTPITPSPPIATVIIPPTEGPSPTPATALPSSTPTATPSPSPTLTATLTATLELPSATPTIEQTLTPEGSQ